MAIFGVQLAFSMIIASLISKVGSRFSLATWLLCHTGLIRYLHPTDEELRELAGIPKNINQKGKGKGKFNTDLKNPNTFHVPKSINLQLDSVKISEVEATNLKYFLEYHYVVDYSIYASLVYTGTEIYCWLFKAQNEMNLSIFWCLLALGLCVKVLATITSIYFKGDEVIGERTMCLVMSLVYLLCAMIILIIDEETLEVGIDPAYRSFYENASKFLQMQNLPSAGPASKLIVKFSIAVCSAIMGGLFTFSGIRMSKMFFDSLKYCEGRNFFKTIINISAISPLVICALWIRPISRDVFTKLGLGLNGEPLMTDSTFDSFRMILILVVVLLRFILMPFFLQSFLNVAQDRLIEQRKDAGRILNTDIQKQVAGIYYYLCIVALQYITPCVILLHCTFLYKTLGEGSWIGSWGESTELKNSSAPATLSSFLPLNDALKPATEHFAIAISSLKQVFTGVVFKGIFGWCTWWCTFLMFTSSGVGSLYLSYYRT